MDYTVSDFYHVFKEKFLLLAGESGLSRGVNSVGILDYELDPSVKDRYICDNFHEGMIVVSTFLYAKKNPYLIGDAVRHLVRKGCSALLIRNVFNLQIPETVLKYADSKGFPILVVNGSGIYFEDFVYEVRHRREQMENIDFYADAIHALLGGTLSPEEIVRRTKEAIPSLRPSYFVAYAVLAESMATDDYLGLLREYQKNSLFSITNKIIKFEENMLFVFSSDTLSQDYGKRLFSAIFDLLSGGGQRELRLGVSAPHYYIAEFRKAILEGKYAASCRPSGREGIVCYDEIGVYRLLLPFCHSQDFECFSEQILDPIRDYDTENGTALFETLLSYVKNDADLKKTAAELTQHENTVRYRLEKIHTVCGLSYRVNAEAEQLSLAVKIHLARGFLYEDKTDM
mgnify:FL=1